MRESKEIRIYLGNGGNQMKLIRTWCEDTKEGMEYLAFNGYSPICRLLKNLWLVEKIGNKLDDVKIIG